MTKDIPNLYSITGKITDFNTLLINRNDYLALVNKTEEQNKNNQDSVADTSSAKHTPGPWRFNHKTSRTIDTPAVIIMCDTPNFAWCPDRNADWRLIAAAPDLLEALQAILPFIPVTKVSDGGAAKYSENVRAADMVRAAFEKATGLTS